MIITVHQKTTLNLERVDKGEGELLQGLNHPIFKIIICIQLLLHSRNWFATLCLHVSVYI